MATNIEALPPATGIGPTAHIHHFCRRDAHGQGTVEKQQGSEETQATQAEGWDAGFAVLLDTGKTRRTGKEEVATTKYSVGKVRREPWDGGRFWHCRPTVDALNRSFKPRR